MKNQNINLAIFENDSREGFKLYLNDLVKIVVRYLINKGYTVKVGTNVGNEIEAIVFLEDVIISVRQTFFFVRMIVSR